MVRRPQFCSDRDPKTGTAYEHASASSGNGFDIAKQKTKVVFVPSSEHEREDWDAEYSPTASELVKATLNHRKFCLSSGLQIGKV